LGKTKRKRTVFKDYSRYLDIGSMTKITLDRETFKALASDTRLDILKTLDWKHLGLNEIAEVSNLNKATLHEHLTKLHEVGLIKRTERAGHKWVYYQLTWKGESLLHPENAKIVVLFTTTFIALWLGIIQVIWFIKGTAVIEPASDFRVSNEGGGEPFVLDKSPGVIQAVYQNPMYLYIAVGCFVLFTVFLCIALWRFWENRTPKI
jgi:DNA-binding HxlR family transcriptional regulator